MIPTTVKGITPIKYEVRFPTGDSSSCFGDIITEPQKFGPWDTDACWDASPYKGTVDMQCNYLISIGAFTPAAMAFFKNPIPSRPDISYLDAAESMKTSEMFSEILGKNMDNGGTAVEAENLFQEYGCIPWSLLHYSDAQAWKWQTKAQFNADYFNPKNVTIDMITLGRQFLMYVNIAFQRIGIVGITPAIEILQAALKQGPLQVGVAIDTNPNLWNQTVVPAPNNKVMAHEITLYKINPTGSYAIVDNYAPFLKSLASNYPLLAVLQGVVTAIPNKPSPVPQNAPSNSFYQAVIGWWNGIFYPNIQVGGILQADTIINNINQNMQATSQTGNILTLSGLIVSIFAHFNIVVTADSITAIFAGLVALYGVIHQVYQVYTTNKAGIAKGVFVK